MLEVEIKIKVNLGETEQKLKVLGFTKGTSVYEYDVYFNGIRTDLKEEDKAVRIRTHRDLETGKEKYVLNFKGPKIDDTTMTREETQFEVPSFSQGKTVLNGLGFFEAGTVEKTRMHYRKDAVTCCLDRVTGLGDFLEVEIMAEEQAYKQAVGEIDVLLTALGLRMKDTVRRSYLSQILQNSAK